jgi:hypothetical protein
MLARMSPRSRECSRRVREREQVDAVPSPPDARFDARAGSGGGG